MRYTKPNTAGFTIIELIVSLGLFAVVSTISVGSLIVLINNNRDLREEQSLITNITFALDMMTREMRTGFDYICGSQIGGGPGDGIFGSNHNAQNVDASGGSDCAGGKNTPGNAPYRHGISFINADSQVSGVVERTSYFIEKASGGSDSPLQIMRLRGNSSAANQPQSIVSDQVTILDADFIVTDTGDNERQPTVTIVLRVAGEDGTEYALQSTVTQRLLNIPES